MPIQSWVEEGINIDTQRKYEVRFDDKSNRIVFPIRDEYGQLINIKGRTYYPNYKDLGVKKYIHYYPVGTPDYLFGMHHNKESIFNIGELIIFEAEKSVFKCDSLGICNAVAAGTHFITDCQVPKLLQLHCDIVIAFDKDVDYKELMNQVNKIKKYTNVYIIEDKIGLLGEKDAPIDKGFETWHKLYNEKVRII
jgi:DNA primase